MRKPARVLVPLTALFLVLSLFEAWHHAAPAQQPCQPPPLPTQTQPNIFSEDQENDLGDFYANYISHEIRVIDDDDLSARLREVGGRLIAHLPPSKIKFQFAIMDLPDTNAFSYAGGRIYVSRKLIAFTHSEDELAGVLGHEMGHILSRQFAVDVTRQLKVVLGVTSVGDRKDIFEKMHQLLDNAGRRPEAFKHSADTNESQMEADRLGLFAAAAAGYDPEAFAAFFDRLTERQGKTGNALSDLFGMTNPDSKRLRELLKGKPALPAGCAPAARGTSDRDDFQRWQAAVVSYSGLGRKESLHGLASKVVLQPPLSAEITHLRFSQDGRYILAQDDGGISVLTRSPLQAVFRIEAPGADDAQFTPDASAVVFASAGLRIEAWGIADKKLLGAHEVFHRQVCLQTALSPDGSLIGCLDEDKTLSLLDVTTGAVVFQKPRFYTPDRLTGLMLLAAETSGDLGTARARLVNMAFSTDGRYFIAGHINFGDLNGSTVPAETTVAYDVKAKAPLTLKGDARHIAAASFAFIGPDRFIGFNADNRAQSGTVTLPGGDVTGRLPLEAGAFTAATKGGYLFYRPYQKYALAVFDVGQQRMARALPHGAIDAFDREFIAERGTGELGVYAAADNSLQASLTMPRNPLGRLQSASVSPDFRWLAVSQRDRGAIWDLRRNALVGQIRGFRSGGFSSDGALVADFPKSGDQKRQFMRIEPATTSGITLDAPADDNTGLVGGYLLSRRVLKKGEGPEGGVTYDLREATTGRSLWTRTFIKEEPNYAVDASEHMVLLAWPSSMKSARDETQGEPALAKQLAELGSSSGYLVEIIDVQSGAARGKVVINTNRNSFRFKRATVAGDWLLLADTSDREQVYSVSTGQAKGEFFGDYASISAEAGLVSVENGPTSVMVYDLRTLERRDEFTFAHAVVLSQLSKDGKRLLVLTADQTVYLFDLKATSSG